MRLSDCEITHRHVRGKNLVVIFGARALAEDELAALLLEHGDTYGPVSPPPVYASPEGWQTSGVTLVDAVEPGPLASRFVFDEAQEIVIVDGVKIAGEVFTAIGTPMPEGDWFRVVSVDDTVTIDRRHVDELQIVPDGVLIAADRAEAFARWELIEAAADQGGAASAASAAVSADKPVTTPRGKKATG